MQKRQIPCGFLGMNQDVRNPQVNQKQAYEIRNLRLNATQDGKALELTSEKSMKLINNSVTGDIIGYQTIGEYIVLFTTDTTVTVNKDRIYKLKYNDEIGNFVETQLFVGDLNFPQPSNAGEMIIESIASYENENVQKVYWTDGVNQPRVINIANPNNNTGVSDPFAFSQIAPEYNTSITAECIYGSGGLFYAGTIQYAFSMFNNNAQETPIINISPLNYIAHSDRGEEPNKQLSCCFNVTIEINEQDKSKFDYIRVYSIHRTSLDTHPLVKVISDISCKNLSSNSDTVTITIKDNNQTGYDFDAFSILMNRQDLKAKTIAQKDNALFLGNVFYSEDLTSDDGFKGLTVTWDTEQRFKIKNDNTQSYYNYENQLKNDSSKIKTFKYLEYYKLGLQFQDEYGNWSDPYVLRTCQNIMHPIINNGYACLPYAKVSLSDIYTVLKGSGYSDKKYIAVRPVVSFPTESERSVLCQGILNPTVFNITDRMQQTCYSQASWFFRPSHVSMYPWFDYYNGNMEMIEADHDTYLWQKNYNAENDGSVGSKVEFRHFASLHDSSNISGEIQGMYYDDWIGQLQDSVPGKFDVIRVDVSQNDDPVRPYHGIRGLTVEYSSKYPNYYFVDRSVVTLNSPDIEFNETIANNDLSHYKIRVVGAVSFSNSSGQYNILAQTPLTKTDTKEVSYNVYEGFRTGELEDGFVYKSIYNVTTSGKRACAQACWHDSIANLSYYNDGNLAGCIWRMGGYGGSWNGISAYFVYPWNREHLNNWSAASPVLNYGTAGIASGYDYEKTSESSKIISKILANCIVSENTVYFDNTHELNVGQPRLFNDDNVILSRIQEGKYYQGNVDKILTYTSNFVDFKYDSDSTSFNGNGTAGRFTNKTRGYPITAYLTYSIGEDKLQMIENAQARPLSVYGNGIDNSGTTAYMDVGVKTTSTDPILMQYKSTPHLYFPFLLDEDNYRDTLPQLYTGTYAYNIPYTNNNNHPCWYNNGYDDADAGYNIDLIEYSGYNDFDNYLLIADVYKDQDPIYTNDNNDFDIHNRLWVPCGSSKHIDLSDTETSEIVKFTEGDTFFQRYDCLKTYPYSNDSYQGIVEIASFMCETYINIDGRYDKNRGLYNNTIVTNQNFNKLNSAYSQKNNFFTYSIIDKEKTRYSFPTSFIWSLEKQSGSDVDNWTKITTNNIYDLDGSKGLLNKIIKWRDKLYAFQDHAISRIDYNAKTVIKSESGVPIEISNSQKVSGVEYINELYGCQNIHNVCVSNDGVYFHDGDTPGIYKMGSDVNVNSITRNVMQGWIENKDNVINGIYYDGNMNELLFMFKNDNSDDQDVGSLAYQDGLFTSFYNYKGVMFDYMNHSVNIYNNKIHFMREGNGFNTFYNSDNDYRYYVQFIANPSGENGQVVNDCIFDNVEYMADVYDSSNELVPELQDTNYPFWKRSSSSWFETFGIIECKNSYQTSSSDKHNDFKKKFRTWRVPIPRNGLNSSRMRDSWLSIKLMNIIPSTKKFVLKNILVDVFC